MRKSGGKDEGRTEKTDLKVKRERRKRSRGDVQVSKAKRCWVGNGWIKRKRSVWRRRQDGKDGVIEGLEQEEKDGGIGRKTECGWRDG